MHMRKYIWHMTPSHPCSSPLCSGYKKRAIFVFLSSRSLPVSRSYFLLLCRSESQIYLMALRVIKIKPQISSSSVKTAARKLVTYFREIEVAEKYVMNLNSQSFQCSVWLKNANENKVNAEDDICLYASSNFNVNMVICCMN